MAGYIGSKASVVSSGAERKKTFTITGATTSLTGLNYTVGKVHVFQNGVRLVDGTDYTATNGTTITLTVAAQSGDNVVVISQASFQVADALLTSGGTMTGDLTVQGAFTSQGIDDNGNAVALTIDINENVLVGQTTNALADTGHILDSSGTAYHIRDGASPLILNRKSSDGSITEFYKNGATVGSIGVTSGSLGVGQGDTGVGFFANDNIVFPSTAAGATRDNAIDLGYAGGRFKDAYLSGGVYLGGTGSANKLDDYEEGTWTPILGGSTGTSGQSYSTQHGSYTKIGRVVHLQAYVVMASIGTSTGAYGQVQNLPFTAAPVQGYGGGIFQYFNLIGGTSVSQLIAYPEGNTTFAYVLYTAGSGTTTSYLGSSGWGTPTIMLSMTYLTNS